MYDLQERNDHFEHTDLSALVCVDEPDFQAVAIDHLGQLAFAIHTALTMEEIATRMEEHSYNVIIASETFAQGSATENHVVREVDRLALATRRDTFVIMIGDGMVTRSDLQAFILGVDLVINSENIGELKSLAGRGVVRQEEFYSTFKTITNAVRATL